jgi:geranylgeranyl diphosphate synthase type I
MGAALAFAAMDRPPPPSLQEIAARVDTRLERLLDDELERWTAFAEELHQPLSEIARLVRSGGKRLRPAFCHWGFVGAGGEPDAASIDDAGAAFELMHAFALFHDDVMDDAATRRGAPTTHSLAAADHVAHGWSGESRRFGDGVAILVGDLAFVYADVLLATAPPAAWAVWNELRIELNVGQYLDILGSVQRTRDLDHAERIARYKSGKYTIERPLHLGAVLAAPDRTEELLPALSAYGLPLGDAFQMRDDVMGAFGDADVTGKPVGGDLLEGKPTPLLALAVDAADDTQRDVLELVGNPGLDDDQIASIQTVIVETGALGRLEDRIEALTAEATEAIECAPITPTARTELVALADYVSSRTT